MRREQLAEYKVNVLKKRYVHDGKILTSAGVSAGIDMALYLAAKLFGDNVAKMIQLGVEYNPEPPFDAGSPEKIPVEILNKFMSRK
jgi:transcriptional regulator GlxA family with amidase domain